MTTNTQHQTGTGKATERKLIEDAIEGGAKITKCAPSKRDLSKGSK